jgi:ABC-2 type transport system permease protein
MKSLLKMTWMEAKLFLREPVGAFFTFIVPLIYLFLFGSISGNEPTPMSGGRGAIDAAIPSLTAMIISIIGLVAITITLTTYRERSILRRLRTTPIRPLIVLVSQVIVVFTMTCLGMLLLIIVGALFYQLSFEGNIFSMLAGFILSSLSFFGIGFILAGIMPTVRTAQIVGNALLYPMIFLSGAFFPIDLFPKVIQKFAVVNPLTYVVNLLRGLWFGEPWNQHWLDVGILACILLLGTAISVKTFRWE